ncbi:MAG: hypothetical protein LUE29_00800 [Lachnospiraceae bacterium]|nr:hypothetical protein [Lachnospiraceae bacterium]
MPIKEKRMLTPRYLWKVCIYAMDIVFLFVSLSLALDLYRISSPEIGEKYLRLLQGGVHVQTSGNTMLQFAKIIAVLCMVAFLGLLLTLRRLCSNDMCRRRKAEWLMYSEGYRRIDVVSYEEAYVMTDLFLSFLLAVLLTAPVAVLGNQINAISLVVQALEQKSCITWEAYLATAAIVAVSVGIDTAWQAASRWGKRDGQIGRKEKK